MDQDALSKRLFALPQVMADALRIVAGDWADELNLDALERLPAEHAGTGPRRVGDMAWRVPFRSGRLKDGTRPYLVLPTEFQSRPDPRMDIRQGEYALRLLDALHRDGTASREGRRSPVLPLVIYNGDRPWPGEPDPLEGLSDRTARALARHQPSEYFLLDAGAGSGDDWPQGNRVSAWALLQRGGSPEELTAALRSGLSAFPGAADASFREALHAWGEALWLKLAADGPPLPALGEFEKGDGKMTTIGEARMRAYRDRILRESREEGLEQGRLEGRLEGREQGRVDMIERIRREAARSLDPAVAQQLSKLIDGLS